MSSNLPPDYKIDTFRMDKPEVTLNDGIKPVAHIISFRSLLGLFAIVNIQQTNELHQIFTLLV